MIEAGFLLLFLLLFLSLGTSMPPQVALQSILGGLVFAGSLWVYRKEIGAIKKSSALRFLLAFMVFLGIRFFIEILGLIKLPDSAVFPLKWFVGAGVLLSGYLHFTERKRIRRLLWTGAFAGLFLALSALPALFRADGNYGYLDAEGRLGFFPPLFYFHPTVEKYFLSRLTHVNYTGDLMGVGFFCALGLLIYSLGHWHKKGILNASSLGIPAVILLATAGALLLFLARGTILSFTLALTACFLVLMLKFHERPLRLLTAAAGLGVIISLLWIVNPERVWREMATIQKEWGPDELSRSISGNEEGARRALLIFKDHPLWGVGTDGFKKVSKEYAPEEVKKGLRETPFVANSLAMSHWLQVLADEGAGAFFYFLFIFFFFVEALRGMRCAGSRFQFIAGLSLLASVSLILIHATIHYLMELFPVFLLVSALMGAVLGLLRKDANYS